MLRLRANFDFIRVGNTVTFVADGGTAPYTYEVISGWAEGTINSATGLYAAPIYIPDDPRNTVDTIVVTDNVGDKAELEINILTIEEIIAKILMNELELDYDQVFLYNQKWTLPNDARMYVSVSSNGGKPIGNNRGYDSSGSGLSQIQTITMKEIISIDLHSSSTAALKRKEELIMAIASTYSQGMQEAHSFNIAKIPQDMNNLSNIEGAAIPYRFNFSFVIQYAKSKVKAVPYFNVFAEPNIIVNS